MDDRLTAYRTRRLLIVLLGAVLVLLVSLVTALRPARGVSEARAGYWYGTGRIAGEDRLPVHILLPQVPERGSCLVVLPSGVLELSQACGCPNDSRNL
jgi:hypothetical protein